jgi:seryl-tRNA synthetase
MLIPQRTETTVPANRSPDELAYLKLKSRQDVLNTQVRELTEKRDELAGNMTDRSGVDLEGAQNRLKALDAQLQQAEADLGAVTKEMAAAAPAELSFETRTVYRGFDDGDMVGAGFGGAAIMFALFIPLLYRTFRRRRWVPAGSTSGQTPAIGSERIERMEMAIDSIAVEMERVSENQRFMTRLMTETQLAGTLAAVRGSTEAAKAAAERSHD